MLKYFKNYDILITPLQFTSLYYNDSFIVYKY